MWWSGWRSWWKLRLWTWWKPHSTGLIVCMSQFQLFRNVVHIQQSVWVSKFYKNPLQNLRMECWSTFQRMKIPMGNFQVCDVPNILFKFEKLLVKHLEGFIFLWKEGGELQNFFRTFNHKFQLKDSKKFPHWISKSWCINGERNVCDNNNELLRKKVYWSRYWI